MRPHRVRLTHHLVVNYGLFQHMNVLRPKPASKEDLNSFHSDEYIRFLSDITPDNMHDFLSQLERYNLGADCPVFSGLYEYCQTYTGGSISGAARLNQGCSDIVLNWSGGMHHAKKGEASGFCYINDIVLAILELLKVHPRVLYIDIDIHHGDGVEEAFYLTNRVMTLSFHQCGGNFFPGTGHVNDTGAKLGKNYSLNFPLLAGMDDAAYDSIFKPVVQKVMEHFQPGAVVMCCGADSLSGDRVGCWNLSIRGHTQCLELMKSFNVPLLVLGGGGYTIRLLDQHISDNVPWHEYMDYYGPDYKLHVPVSNMENNNTRASLEKTKARVLEALSSLEHCPNVQIQTGQPGTRQNPDSFGAQDSDEEEDWEADTRLLRHKRCHLAEYFGPEGGDRMDTDRLRVRDFEEPPSDDDAL
ncbi:MAG: hypothetical protein SGPRY_000003 [Prymnesium sp.]